MASRIMIGGRNMAEGNVMPILRGAVVLAGVLVLAVGCVPAEGGYRGGPGYAPGYAAVPYSREPDRRSGGNDHRQDQGRNDRDRNASNRNDRDRNDRSGRPGYVQPPRQDDGRRGYEPTWRGGTPFINNGSRGDGSGGS
jgi:hypothetical protein